jgi:DNA-binding NarL/FixJ family response regulator
VQSGQHLVNEAMNVGGHGYVTKIDAAAELLEAIKSVQEGTRFVSQRIRDQGWTADTVKSSK